MKNLLITLYNICNFISYSCLNLLGVIWTGQLPKVSIHHQMKSIATFKEIFYDPISQSKVWPHPDTEKRGARKFAEALTDSRDFKANLGAIDVPIFDGVKIIGSKGGASVVFEELKKFNT